MNGDDPISNFLHLYGSDVSKHFQFSPDNRLAHVGRDGAKEERTRWGD